MVKFFVVYFVIFHAKSFRGIVFGLIKITKSLGEIIFGHNVIIINTLLTQGATNDFSLSHQSFGNVGVLSVLRTEV